MAADPGTVERVQTIVADRKDVTERKMFGGLAVMVSGNMLCAISSDHMVIRVGKEGHAEALQRPHARPMDFTGRPMTGYVTVDPPAYQEDADLEGWIRTALEFVATLPPK